MRGRVRKQRLENLRDASAAILLRSGDCKNSSITSTRITDFTVAIYKDRSSDKHSNFTQYFRLEYM
jgi:hypothetical protein